MYWGIPGDRIRESQFVPAKEGSGVVLLTRLRRSGNLLRCHDDCEFPAAGLRTTSSIARWRGSGSSGRQRTTRPSRRSCARRRSDCRCVCWGGACCRTLAFGAVAVCRRRFVGVHAMAERYAHAALAQGAPHVGHGRVVPGTLRVLPEPGGRAPVDGVALCGAERLAREVGRICGGVALVQPVASAQRRRRGVGGRGAGAVVPRLAAACAVAAEGGRAGGAAAIGGAGNALRRGVLAGANGQATALAIDASPTWPPEEGSAGRGCQRDLRLPTAFGMQAPIAVTGLLTRTPYADP